MGVSVEKRALAKYLRSVVGGSPTVGKYWDDAQKSDVDVFVARDVPTVGVSTYATLGLSDFSINLKVGAVPLTAEFLMAVGAACDIAANVLATCAFNVINTKMECKPGSVFPGIVEMYRPKADMKHILFVPPFLWNLQTQSFPTKTVAWLQAVPISDAESAFASQRGSDALENLFEERKIDVFDFDRESVV